MATPVAAQDEVGEADMTAEALGAMLGEDEDFQKFLGAFKPEPLTPEQEARQPLATQVVGAMMPDGATGEMMSSMFRDIIDPLSALRGDGDAATASSLLGWYVGDEDLDEEAASEIVAIIDPARAAREKATMDAIEKGIADVMLIMEPAMREAMSKAFAANFDDTELTDIGTFFATPSGASFAAKSYKLSSDPRLFVGMLENLPQLLGPIMAAVAEGEEAIGALPQTKSFAELTPAERARLAALSGLTEAELEDAMAAEPGDEAMEESADAVEEEYDS